MISKRKAETRMLLFTNLDDLIRSSQRRLGALRNLQGESLSRSKSDIGSDKIAFPLEQVKDEMHTREHV